MATTDEVRPQNRLRIAILIVVVAAWILSSPWISPIGSPPLSMFVALVLAGAAWVTSRPPTTRSIRFTTEHFEITGPTGATRHVARERVASMGVEGARVVTGIMVRSRLFNGNPGQLVVQDRDGVVLLARSITWFRGATLENFAARHGVAWRGVHDDCTPIPIGPPTDWPSAVTPPPPTVATDDPVTVELVDRIRRRTTLYGRLVLVGWGLVILATWWPMADRYIGVVNVGVLLLVLETGTWSKRRTHQKHLAATLAVRAWTAIEALVTDGSAEHRTGRYVRFLDPLTGTPGPPFALRIGTRVPWLIPTERVWLLCAPTGDARTFWVAPSDRSGITVVTLADQGSVFFRRTPVLTA